jgi:PhnB protein
MMSTIQLSPYINFQGRAHEALEFYHQVLGGTLDLHTVTAQGGAQPAGPEDRIMYARLEADGVLLIATDGHPAYPAQVGDAMALALSGTDQDRLTQIFQALAAGGKIKQPLTAQPWGATVGWLMDQFGISWMVQIAQA